MKKFSNIYTKLFTALLLIVGSTESKRMAIIKEPNQPAPITTQITPTPSPILSKPTSDPEVINIDKSVKIIDNQQNCNASNWNNDQDDACQCCLTYSKGQFGTKHSADEIINHCIHSKQCNPSSIENIKNKYNAQNKSSEDFINTLYENTTVIHKIDVNPSLLTSNGVMTEEGLANILVQAYNEGKLKNKEFNNKECLKVKSLGSGS